MLFKKMLFSKRRFSFPFLTMVFGDDFIHDFVHVDDDSDSLMMLEMLNAREVRREKWQYNRINWKEHLEKL